jgi:hypothetical protein
MRYLFRVPDEAMISLMSDALGTHGHVATTEPSHTRRRVWNRRTRDDTGALPYRVVGPVPRGTWQR